MSGTASGVKKEGFATTCVLVHWVGLGIDPPRAFKAGARLPGPCQMLGFGMTLPYLGMGQN